MTIEAAYHISAFKYWLTVHYGLAFLIGFAILLAGFTAAEPLCTNSVKDKAKHYLLAIFGGVIGLAGIIGCLVFALSGSDAEYEQFLPYYDYTAHVETVGHVPFGSELIKPGSVTTNYGNDALGEQKIANAHYNYKRQTVVFKSANPAGKAYFKVIKYLKHYKGGVSNPSVCVGPSGTIARFKNVYGNWQKVSCFVKNKPPKSGLSKHDIVLKY